MKHREKYRASKPPDAQLELLEQKPRRVLDLESLARMHRDFAGKGKRPYQRRQRQGRRE
jgi:hypothetical protein